MIEPLGAIPRPTQTPSTILLWLDEQVWGHRLHDEQSPWLVFMEFLNIFSHEFAKGRAFQEPQGHNRLSYQPAKRILLRNVLFNNPGLHEIRLRHSADDARWAEWFAHMEAGTKGIDHPDFKYLRKRFHSFEDFCEVVDFIRSTSLEMASNKRWTSKFVFPYGDDCLYEDLDNEARTNDRRFFGRTGELLYLMLCRAKRREELLDVIGKKCLRSDSRWNRLVRALQPAGDVARDDRAGSYLPYEAHPCFDDLADDWLTVLRLDLPDYDPIPHLVNLAGLHVAKYQLAVARRVLGQSGHPLLVCEILAPQRSLVREVSCQYYDANNLLPAQALEAVISTFVETESWLRALASAEPFINCRELLRKQFLWPMREDDYDGSNDPRALLKEFRRSALDRHRQHVANIHRNYGKEVGLVSRRGTVKLRYAPNDSLLTTLLLANVPKRLELNRFLARLYERYGFVFGDREAEIALAREEFDKKAFQANARRLEQRLGSLGLLRRLSDGCAYVVNPFSSQ